MKQIPNLLSTLRILLIPVILWVYLGAEEPSQYLLAGVLLAVSGITDMLDGYIARRFHFITNLGKVLDPIADKLTQISVAVALWLRHAALWPLPVFLILKEVTMGVCGLLLYRRQGVVSQARWYGKLATIVYYLVIFILIIYPPILDGGRVWIPISLVVLAMIFSGVRYAMEFGGDLKHRKN